MKKDIVEGECKKPTSKYGCLPYERHFVPMHSYAVNLAKRLGANLEVVEIAAWLHDIGSIIYRREDHHITGADIAEEQLKKLRYPKNKIELVKKCILNHRGSVNNHRGSLEEQIIAEADAMNAFDRIEGLFEAAFVWEKLDRDRAKKSVKQKLINKYNQLSIEGKGLVRDKYNAAMLLLG